MQACVVTLLLASFLLGVSRFLFLNYACLFLDTGIPRDTVQRRIQETLLFLSCTLGKKQAVDFVFNWPSGLLQELSPNAVFHRLRSSAHHGRAAGS